MLSRLTLISLLSAVALCAQTQQPTQQPTPPKPITSQPVEDLVDQLAANASVYRANNSALPHRRRRHRLRPHHLRHLSQARRSPRHTFRAIRKSDDKLPRRIPAKSPSLNGKPRPAVRQPHPPRRSLPEEIQAVFRTCSSPPAPSLLRLRPARFRHYRRPHPDQHLTLKPSAATIPGCEPGLTGLHLPAHRPYRSRHRLPRIHLERTSSPPTSPSNSTTLPSAP